MLRKKCLIQGIQKTKVTLFYKTYISRNLTHSYPPKQNITDGNNIEILFDEERYFHNLFPLYGIRKIVMDCFPML